MIKAPQLRHDVSDAVAYLATRPIFAATASLGVTITSGADETFGFDGEIADTWGGHTPPSSAYFCRSEGWYLCQAAVPYDYLTATQYVFAAGFKGQAGGSPYGPLRGALQLMGSGRDPMPQAVDLIEMTQIGPVGGSGDWLEVVTLQVTGSDQTLLTSATKLPYFTLRWVAAPTGTASLAVPSNPSWPTPPTVLTSAFMNSNVRDTIRFLTYPPIYRAHYAAGSTTLASTAFPAGTLIQLNTIDVDNYSGGTTGATSRYTAPVGGVYFVYGQVNLASDSNSTGYCAGLAVNGGTIAWGDSVYKLSDSTGGGMIARKRLRLNAGDYVQLFACQGTGSAITYNPTAENETRMIVVWESA